MTIPYFIHPFTSRWTFSFLAIVKNIVMNIRVQVFVWSYVFILTDELKETRLRYLKDGKALVLVKLGLG